MCRTRNRAAPTCSSSLRRRWPSASNHPCCRRRRRAAVRTRPAATRPRQANARRPRPPLQRGERRAGRRAQQREASLLGAARRTRRKARRRPRAGAAARQAPRLARPTTPGRGRRAAPQKNSARKRGSRLGRLFWQPQRTACVCSSATMVTPCRAAAAKAPLALPPQSTSCGRVRHSPPSASGAGGELGRKRARTAARLDARSLSRYDRVCHALPVGTSSMVSVPRASVQGASALATESDTEQAATTAS